MWNKISNRILLGYSIPIFSLFIFSIIISLSTINSFKIERETEQITEQIRKTNAMAEGVSRMISSIRAYMVFPGDPFYKGTYQDGYKIFEESNSLLEENLDPQIKSLVRELYTLGQDYDKISQNFFQLVDNNRLEDAKNEVNRVRQAELFKKRDVILVQLDIQEKKYIESLRRSQKIVIWLLFIGTILTLVATVLTGLRIALPLKQQLPRVVNAAEKISEGDLTQVVEVTEDTTEVGQLLNAFSNMTKNLNSLISQAQKSGVQISTSATQIAASGQELAATVAEQTASIQQVNVTSHHIAVIAGDLSKIVERVAHTSQVTTNSAGNSQANLEKIQAAMQNLTHASISISSKLNAIDEKANNINNIVTAITKVADQTNLLSLNAAIEAEKAGEYGAGFAVVAREIRRLADQTAVATLEIEKMVREMQSSVSTGVTEVDKFSREVERYVLEVGNISQQIAQMIKDVQSLPPQFEVVKDRINEQYQEAQQIGMAIDQLSEASQHTSESIQETNKALTQLYDASQGLQREISQFKLEA